MVYRDFVHSKVIELGKDVLRMTTASGSGHPSSSLSILHTVITLMYDVMHWEPANPWNAAADRLVLSEGHAVPAIYAAYADLCGVVGNNPKEARVLTQADLATLREANSPLDGHPNPAEGFPFFDAATGSLGQGLSVAAGLGWAARHRKLDKQIYVIIGDGESREGQIWEGMDLIAEQKLTNVVAFFNCNGQGQADYVSKQQSHESIAAKAAAFGWEVKVIDGHDPDAIKAALANPAGREKPLAIVARTMKGWGCESLKDKSNHGKPVAPDKLDAAIKELDAMYERLQVKRPPPCDQKSPSACSVCPAHPHPKAPKPAAMLEQRTITPVDFKAGMAQAGLASVVEKGKLSTRRAYGAALLVVGESDERIVALDGDVSNSTYADIFGKKHHDRFVECKIAEQNMISTAAGLSAAGFVPFVSSFAKFIARAYDQVEMAQITRANIKITGSHSGISLAADGPSQMALHDVAYFRAASETDNGRGKPICVSFHPSDAVSAYYCTWLMANHDGMCYMRTHRSDVPLLYAPNTPFEIGGSHVLETGDALTIVTAGFMVHVCLDAIKLLAGDGIKCTLIDAYSFPLKTATILEAARKTGNRILCVEDNYVGGLAGTIAEAAAEAGNIRVSSMTCRRMPKSTRTPEDMMAYAGLSPKDIAAKGRAMVRSK